MTPPLTPLALDSEGPSDEGPLLWSTPCSASDCLTPLAVEARKLALPASLAARAQACALLKHARVRFRSGSWAARGSQHNPASTLCPCWWQRHVDLGRHADGGGLGALGPASVVNAVISFFFLFWWVLRVPLRTSRAGSHSTASAGVPLTTRPWVALGNPTMVAACSRMMHSWAGHCKGWIFISFSACLPLQCTWVSKESSPLVGTVGSQFWINLLRLLGCGPSVGTSHGPLHKRVKP